MKVPIFGRRSAVELRRSDPTASPGSLLGENRIACVRCGEEFSVGELREILRSKGSDKLYVCKKCLTREEKR